MMTINILGKKCEVVSEVRRPHEKEGMEYVDVYILMPKGLAEKYQKHIAPFVKINNLKRKQLELF